MAHHSLHRGQTRFCGRNTDRSSKITYDLNQWAATHARCSFDLKTIAKSARHCFIVPAHHTDCSTFETDRTLGLVFSDFANCKWRALPVSRLIVVAIVFQMGRARLTARGTALKSTTLARPEARLIVLSAGPARWPFSAWAATLARRAGPRHGPIFGGPIIGPIKIHNHI
jgi:hypothetical protein